MNHHYFTKITNILLDSVIKLIPCRKIHYDLVFLRSDGLGDFVMFLDILKAYRDEWPGKKILLVCPEGNMALARASNYCDEYFGCNRNKVENEIVYHQKMMWKAHKISSDIVVNPQYSTQSMSDYICRMIDSPRKIGYKCGERNNALLKWCERYYSELIELPQNIYSEFEIGLFILKRYLNNDYQYHLSDLKFINSGYNQEIEGTYCVISLSSSTIEKDWPINYLVSLVDDVPTKYSIVISGLGATDQTKANFIINHDNGHHVIYNYVNKTTTIDLINLISKAEFVIGNDSAAVHIAASCRVRSICFLHGAQFGRFLPYPDFISEQSFHPRCVYKKLECYGCGFKCNNHFEPNQPFYCLREVTVDMAKLELIQLLNELDKK